MNPDAISMVFGTGFERFHSSCGIEGLAKVRDHELDLLAVIANKPGSGEFRTFINNCKAAYNRIALWHVHNPILEQMLKNYGFQPVTEFERGEKVIKWQWVRKVNGCKSCQPPASSHPTKISEPSELNVPLGDLNTPIGSQ